MVPVECHGLLVPHRDGSLIPRHRLGEMRECRCNVSAIQMVDTRLDRTQRLVRGMAELRRLLPGHITPICCPIARRKHVQRAMRNIHPEAVRVVGSLKFDSARLEERRLLDVPGMLRRIEVPEDARVLVAGSTHDGEEAILAEMTRRLRTRFPSLFLILVPHLHPC